MMIVRGICTDQIHIIWYNVDAVFLVISMIQHFSFNNVSTVHPYEYYVVLCYVYILSNAINFGLKMVLRKLLSKID